MCSFPSGWKETRDFKSVFDVAGDKKKLHDYLVNVLGDNLPEENTSQMGRWLGDPPNLPPGKQFTKVMRIYGYPSITRNGLLPPP